MIRQSIVLQTFRELAHHPLGAMFAILALSVLLFLMVGFTAEFRDGRWTDIRFVGGTIEDSEGILILRQAGRTLGTLTVTILLFLMILQSASVAADSLQHPLLGITLAAGVPRSAFLMSRLGACWLFQMMMIMGTTIGAALILRVRCNVDVFAALIGSGALLACMAFIVLALSTVLGTVTGQSILTTLALLGYSMYLNPLLDLYAQRRGWGSVAGLLFPPIIGSQTAASNMMLGSSIDLSGVLSGLPMAVLCFWSAMRLFRRRDLR